MTTCCSSLSPTASRRVFTPLDLSRFNGEDDASIYISFLGSVYDVTMRPDLYGRSPLGPYHLFAGRECARALATMSLEPHDVGRTDIEDLSALTKKLAGTLSEDEVRDAVSRAMKDWHEKFAQSYPVVGELRPWLQGQSLPPTEQQLTKAQGAMHGHPMVGVPRADLQQEPEMPPGPLAVLCRKPRLHLQRRFLSRVECRRLIAMTLRRQEGRHFSKKVRAPLLPADPLWTDEERSFLENIEERLAQLTGSPVHADETALVGTLTPASGEEGISEHLGLHVDTNAAVWRHVTAIIYLSSVSSGGATAFPAAVASSGDAGVGLPSEDEERAIEAAGRLLDLGMDHTDTAVNQGGEAAVAAQELLRAESQGVGLRVQPEEGTVCVFWTRLDDGEIDRHSWHGGSPVPKEGDWKWTLQKFKEVPKGVREDPAALSEYVSATRRAALALSCNP